MASMGSRAAGRVRALVVLVAILAALVSAAAPASAHHRERQREIQHEIDQKRRQIREAEQRERDLLAKIAASDSRRDLLTRQLHELEGELVVARGELLVLEGKVDALTVELQHKSQQLEFTIADLQAKQELLDRRVSNMYIDVPTALAAAVEVTEQLDDFVGAREYASRLVRLDIRLVGEVESARLRITSERAALEAKQQELMQARDEVLRAARRIATARNQQAAARAAIQREIEAKQRIVAEIERDRQKWERQIRELQRESRLIENLLRGRQRGQPVVKGQGGYLKWPVSGRITSGYGWRTHPIFHRRSFHAGIDIGAPTGAPVGAARDGTVVQTGYYGGYGNLVIIDHGNSLATVYAHLSRIYMRPGERVRTGSSVGAVGQTGYATGPHLHFEVRVQGAPQNPLGWL